jgi:hypothetical protein
MSKIARGIAGIVLFGLGVAALCYGCSLGSISRRAYLDRCFWQPFANYLTLTVRNWRTREPDLRPFAGYSVSTSASAPLVKARSDFRLLSHAFEESEWENDEAREMLPFDAMRQTIEEARRQNGLTADDKDELELMAAKVDLREGLVGDKVRLLSAQSRLRAFLQRAPASLYRSEARGWLACACYHLDQYSEATRISLDELRALDSNFNSQSLATSLRLVINKAEPTLAAHIGEYFDTPEHALFIFQIIDSSTTDGLDPKLIRQNGNVILGEMEKHRQLFSKKEDAEKLALAMMRVSLVMGDMGRLLQYAREIPDTSKTRQSPDYYWMVGCAHFLNHNFAAAERPLLKMLKAPNASLLRQGKASMALMGVYERLHRPLDELDVALKWRQIRRRHKDAQAGDLMDEPSHNYVIESDPLMPFADYALDLSILLDSELTVEQLQQYWDAHPDSDRLIPYSLAVRYARQEKYDRAARLYAQAGANERHRRMLELQTLYAAAQAPSRSPEEVQQSRFAYARFLSRHSCGVFYNDRLWAVDQNHSFIDDFAASVWDDYYDRSDNQQNVGLIRTERERIIQQQRRFLDEQREYWCAYNIFNGIVEAVGPTSLGRQAAIEAIRCLDNIGDRFGRKEEVKAETSRLVKWLKSHRAA